MNTSPSHTPRTAVGYGWSAAPEGTVWAAVSQSSKTAQRAERAALLAAEYAEQARQSFLNSGMVLLATALLAGGILARLHREAQR